jgi:hypothetical protein
VIWEPEHLITLDDTSAERQHAGTDVATLPGYFQGLTSFLFLGACFVLILVVESTTRRKSVFVCTLAFLLAVAISMAVPYIADYDTARLEQSERVR